VSTVTTHLRKPPLSGDDSPGSDGTRSACSRATTLSERGSQHHIDSLDVILTTK